MKEEPEEIGPAGKAVREALFGRQSDDQIRKQLRYTDPGSDGAEMLKDELERRRRERHATDGWLARTLHSIFG